MSHFDSPDGQRIPMGILVEAAKKPGRTDQSAPRKRPADGGWQIPWLWVAVGGSVGWVFIIMVIAILTMNQEAVSQPEARLPKPLAVDGGLDFPAPLKVALPEPKVDLPEVDDIVVPVPKLERKGPALPGDEGPPAVIIPKVVNPEPAPVPAPPPVAPKAAKKEIDLRIFQNCEQIGTSVLFVRNPVDAFQRAKEEKKMVFMVHLSGNLEDPGFT